MFFLEHHVDPALLVAGEHAHDLIQQWAFEALARIDLPDFFALALGPLVDLVQLAPPGLIAILVFGARTQKIADRHAESVSQQIGKAHDDDDSRRQTRTRNPRHHGKSGHRAVDGTVDEIFQINGLGSAFETLCDLLGGMLVLVCLATFRTGTGHGQLVSGRRGRRILPDCTADQGFRFRLAG